MLQVSENDADGETNASALTDNVGTGNTGDSDGPRSSLSTPTVDGHTSSVSTTSRAPRKKQRVRVDEAEEAATNALRSANEVMSGLCQRMANPTQLQQPGNETRAYCDMLYYQLIAFHEMEREEIQLELQQVIMRHKRRRLEPTPKANADVNAAVGSSCVMSDADKGYAGTNISTFESVSSAVAYGYSVVADDASEAVLLSSDYPTYYDL